jgi:protein arginine kinase activator
MLCDICHKKEAAIYFKGIFNGHALEMNLCEECGRKKGMEFEQEIQLSDFVSQIVDLGMPSARKEKKETSCPACGLAYSEFKRTGRLGCGDCYGAFSPQLLHLLERIQGRTRHIGRIPCGARNPEKGGMQKQRELLRKRLAEAVRCEKYEEAAQLRDKLGQLGLTGGTNKQDKRQ